MDIQKLKLLDLESLAEIIYGAEGDENGSTGDSTDSSSTDQGSAGGASDDASGDADDDDDEHDDRDDPKVKGLRSALAKERRERARLEKEAKARARADEEADLKTKSDIEQAQAREKKANDKLTKLVDGYRNSAVDRAIEKAASAANFVDTNDALAGVDRSLISVEQDDEDPSVVTIDAKSVERAVKRLASDKPHWLKQAGGGTTDGKPTGSGFGGGKSGGDDKSREATLREKYPSLR